ncbi:U-box domain-containing protein 15-like [Hibiscus syriacus]|uniref:U-box domain-containing protein 15-like n=1 Tax=Hibiscus syriacus TaxID=106335 RepID=A0A6A3C5G0_HIBSY|nr:U-box domain-containing protein 15-like [Hibiscus syriacus]
MKVKQPSERRKNQVQKQPSSWDQIKNLLSCKQIEGSKVHDPSKNNPPRHHGYSKLSSYCNSIRSFKDVVHGNSRRVVHRADNSPESSTVGQESGLLRRKTANNSKLSGCYECHMIVDPSRHPSSRTTICACSLCGEVFPKIESLELHQAVRHAVSELGPDDSGRNIVEIIFKSSWLKKDNRSHQEESQVCSRRQRTPPIPLHHIVVLPRSAWLLQLMRAMLVCRVIAGRVKRMADDAPPLEEENNSSVSAPTGSYDSIAAYAGVYSDLEELVVFNPRAILPCFVVIYKALESSLN